MAAYPRMSMGEAHRRITKYLNPFSDAVSNEDTTSLSPPTPLSSSPSPTPSTPSKTPADSSSTPITTPSSSISSSTSSALSKPIALADRELASDGKLPEKLKVAGSLLMKVFGVLVVCFSFQKIS
nr:enhanced ethylene response protein 5 [Quercus suber]